MARHIGRGTMPKNHVKSAPTRARLRALPASRLKLAAADKLIEAETTWRGALGRADAAEPLLSLLDDWAEFSGLDYRTLLTKILTAQEAINNEWTQEHPQTSEAAALFYDKTQTLIPLLVWWHGTEPGPARCANAAAGVFGAVGASSVLDFGCGIGSTALVLAAAGFKPILAEVAREALRFADFRMRVRNYDRKTLDLLSTELASLADSLVDAVVALDVFEHLPNPETTLQQLDRLLVSGGTICLNQVFLPERMRKSQEYTRRGELLLWLHEHGYRLAHVMDIFWIAQKEPLSKPAMRMQGLQLRARIACARMMEGWSGPVGRRLAFYGLRLAVR